MSETNLTDDGNGLTEKAVRRGRAKSTEQHWQELKKTFALGVQQNWERHAGEAAERENAPPSEDEV